MFNNIKLIGLIFLSVLLLTNCKKENKDTQSQGEIVFAPFDAGSEKDGEFDVICNEALVVTHARVNLNGTFYYPETFILDGKLYTQSIKLDVGNYVINEFSLMADPLNTPDNHGDDVVYQSTPMMGSAYAQYVSMPIGDPDLNFDITAFQKNEFAIDVLCYIPAEYSNFGFEWFEVTPITIREQCFFGDFCIKDVTQYTGSLYGPNVMLDEVAIFKIDLYKDDILYGTYYNTSQGENGLVYTSPLCIEYPDYDMKVDKFRFDLSIYVTSGNTWAYVPFYSWTFFDAEKIPAGTDGVVDFVLGNCVSSETDLLLPPWMNLPMGGDYVFALSNGNVGPDSYWDMTIGGIGSNLYDMQNGTYPGWCADEFTTIGNGVHCMDAVSSLYPEALPDYWLNEMPAGPGALSRLDAIGAANWLWNHEADYDYNFTQMQNALWNLFNNKVVTGVASDMATAARMHTDYSPLPGGWAAIYFIPCNDELELQMTFFVVDP